METLAFVGGEFWIQNNEQLTDISSLSALQEVGENMGIIYNTSLSSLEGLNNISPESIFNLSIHNNPLLTHCAIESICNYLLNPAGEVQIHDNASGCDSQIEVEDACWTKVNEIGYDDKITISPNPSSGSMNLRYTIYKQELTIIELFEVSGVKIKTLLNEVKSPGTYEMEIDLSDLKSGVYFCVLKTIEGIQTRKILKL